MNSEPLALEYTQRISSSQNDFHRFLFLPSSFFVHLSRLLEKKGDKWCAVSRVCLEWNEKWLAIHLCPYNIRIHQNQEAKESHFLDCCDGLILICVFEAKNGLL